MTFIYPPPSDGKAFKLMMGLRSLDRAQWLEAGQDLLEQIPERAHLASQQKSVVYQELPGHFDAIDELNYRIVGNLSEFHSQNYRFTKDAITHIPSNVTSNIKSQPPLLAVATIIGEDLVVLHRENGEWVIVAGAVLFPSRWKLSEKIGKGMDAVHTPVPGFATALAPYMTATFDKITAERPAWRKNWSLHSTKDLHQPISIHADAEPEDYWWRTERQTLTRSIDDDYMFFTIRNRVEPLRWIKEEPEASLAFAETLSTLRPETIEYKGLQADHQKIIDYLRN